MTKIISLQNCFIILFSAFNLSIATEQKGNYGAISISPSTWRIGSANFKASAKEAMDSAHRDCSYSDCRILLTSENDCIALAFSYIDKYDWRYYGLAKGKDLISTEALAIKNCEYNISEKCMIHTSFCSIPPTYDEEPAADITSLLKIIPEGSVEAKGITRMVNTYNPKHLQTQCKFSTSVLLRLEKYSGPFGTLSSLLKVAKFGEMEFDRLIGFARQSKWIP